MEKYFLITYKDGGTRVMWGTEEQAAQYCQECGAVYKIL